MTEMAEHNVVIQAVKDEGSRTREAILGMRDDIKALPAGLAQALTSAMGLSAGSRESATNSGWVVTTGIAVVVAIVASVNGMVGPLRDAQNTFAAATTERIEKLEAQNVVDDQGDEIVVKAIATMETQIATFQDNDRNLYTLYSSHADAELKNLRLEVRDLEQQLRGRGSDAKLR